MIPPVSPTSGTLLLLHRSLEQLLERKIEANRAADVYEAIIHFAHLNEEPSPRYSPARVFADLVSSLTEITSGPVEAAIVPSIVSHALRHVRQAVAGAALGEEMLKLGQLSSTGPWRYDAAKNRFECECVVFQGGNPVSYQFAASFTPMTTRIATWSRWLCGDPGGSHAHL